MFAVVGLARSACQHFCGRASCRQVLYSEQMSAPFASKSCVAELPSSPCSPALRRLAERIAAWMLAAYVFALAGPWARAREHLLLDRGWKFHLGDEWPGALHLENSGTGSGPAAEAFGDNFWRAVDLPHDWAVELPFDRNADGQHGFKALGAKYPANSIGWYRRAFDVPSSDAGKRIWLTFDGVFRDATVWINGWCVRRHEGGYYPFREDITDVVHFGGRNMISVRVDATKTEGWFYEGAGIYRHVWLDKTAPVAIAPEGVYVAPSFKNNPPGSEVAIQVETTLLNTLAKSTSVQVECEIISPEGKSLKTFSASGQIRGRAQEVVSLETVLGAPILWSPESPRLYQLVTTISVAGEVVDRKETPFGIRTVGFDPERGFLLNGLPYRIQGTCNHQDHAGVGAAIPDALQEFRLRKLKEFGCNAIRTSHNPPTPEVLELCDRIGMLVMDESRLIGSSSENLRKWEDQIRRDRNHPSVAIWCIGNEQFLVQDTPEAGRVAQTMQEYAKQLDPLRPVTYASPEDDVFLGINSVIEVRGWNYHFGPLMDKYHAEHPTQPNIGTEQASVVGTRGIYANDPERGYVTAYDNLREGWSATAESWWSYFADRPWLSGAFVWTGFDYRGEPTPYWWPCINSHFGILDTCGFPKDVYYYYKSWWTKETVLHLLPHWNWPGKEGQEILVVAYSNCPQVELFLNGESLGKQTMKSNSKLSWRVKYHPGILGARGYDQAGHILAETRVATTDAAQQLQLTPDRQTINADGEDVSVFTVSSLDAQGRQVPVAQNKIDFDLEGPGRILGVGNGDPSSHEPDTYVSETPLQSIPVETWRWKLATIPKNKDMTPELTATFDDSSWTVINGAQGPEKPISTPDTSAVYRAHFNLTEQELNDVGLLLCFNGCDDEGWYFLNGQFIGESHDWQAQPVFDIKKFARAGDNVITVAVANGYAQGGLNPKVSVKVVGRASVPPWSRSLFNGFAQIIIQSTRSPGEIILRAKSEGLAPATAVVKTQACELRPSAP